MAVGVGCADTRPIRAEQQRLQQRVAHLEQEREQQNQRLAEYKNLLDARAVESEHYQQQLGDLSVAWSAAQERAQQTEHQLAAIRDQVSQLTSQLVKTQNALTDATTRASDTDQTVEKLKL